MTSRETQLDQIQHALGDRNLVWFGTRGDDAAALEDLPNFAACYSIIGAYDRLPQIRALALEDLSGLRVDLDGHDIDDDPHDEPINRLRDAILDQLNVPSAVATYRPSTFLNGITFARQESVRHLGLFKEHQFAFEHKPWVESAVAGLGIPHVKWRYLADRDQPLAATMLSRSPLVIRRSRSSGGSGVLKVTDPAELAAAWPVEPGAFVAVSEFLGETLPVNIAAVIWEDGVTIHWPSVQIIGVPALTGRPFGYCGSDFAAIKSVPKPVIDQLEASTRTIAEWLHDHGYRGAFGADFLISGGTPLFIEVNPRFQGSTHLSSRLSRQLGESCVVTDHLAAHLGFSAPAQQPMAERLEGLPPASFIVHHWSAPDSRGPGGAQLVEPMTQVPGYAYCDVLLARRLDRNMGAPTFRAVFERAVTDSGFRLHPDVLNACPRETRFSSGVKQ